jgi:hypothetical protein
MSRVRPHADRSDRVRRCLLNLLTLLSLLLCVAVVALWVVSYQSGVDHRTYLPLAVLFISEAFSRGWIE